MQPNTRRVLVRIRPLLLHFFFIRLDSRTFSTWFGLGFVISFLILLVFDRGMTPPLFTNTTATTTTTAFAFDPSSSSSTSYSASAFIMDHHIDRRPTPMQLSCPTKTNMTLSSFSMSPSAAIYLRPSNDGALHQLTRDKIDEFLQPMLQSLIELDAEALLRSQRVEPGLGEGAQVFDGYVFINCLVLLRNRFASFNKAFFCTFSCCPLQYSYSTHSYFHHSPTTSGLRSIFTHCRSARSI